MSEFFFSGEPLPLAPSLGGMEEKQRKELEAFHRKLLDYLRRLGAKLSSDRFSDPGDTAVETLALYIRNDFSVAAGPFTNIEWDTQLRVDSPYTHSTTTNPEKLTFNQDGFYIIFLDLFTEAAESFETRVIDADSGDVLSWGGGLNVGVGIHPFTQIVPVHAHNGQTLAIQIDPQSGALVLDANKNRLVIIRAGALAGSGPDPVDLCVLEPWQLWC